MTTPSNQNFDSAANTSNSTNSLTLNGITYTTNGAGTPDVSDYQSYMNETSSGFSGNALFSDMAGSANPNITFAEFKTVDSSQFKLNGLSASVFDAGGSFPHIYTITGYAGGSTGTQVVSVSNFDFGTIGSYGSGNAAITYTRTSSVYNAGTLVFGSGWDHIDTVRFTSTGGVDVVLDNLNFSNPTVSDTTPPTFDVPPAPSNVTTTSFDLSSSINEAGTIYYVVVPHGAAAPTVANVKAGVASSGAALASGNYNANSGNFDSAFPTVTGLTAGTAYDVYFVATDTAGNNQAVVTKLDNVTTNSPPTPTITSATYDAGTHTLTVTGTGMTAGDSIDTTVCSPNNVTKSPKY